MSCTVLAAEHAAGAVAHAIAGGVRKRRLCGLHDQIKRDAEAAAELPVTAGTGAKFMMGKVQGESHLGDLDAAELDAADRMPFADRRPAVAARRGTAAGPRLKHVPDKIA